MSLHVMVDLETLSVGHDASVLSIGAVKFDPNDPSIVNGCDSFYVAIDPISCQNLGLKIDASTVIWWLDEDRAEARSRFLKDERLDLMSALDGFVSWYGTESLPTWGNGATFDNVILRHALKTSGFECPWMFWDDRCYRTLKNLQPDLRMERVGTYHNALDDALAQALHMKLLVASMGLKL